MATIKVVSVLGKKSLTMALSSLVIAGIAKYTYLKVSQRCRDYHKLQECSDSLAMDHIVNSNQCVATVSESVPDVTTLVLLGGSTNGAQSLIRDNMELEMTPVKEKRHRRLPHPKRSGEYKKCVIAELRVRFGLPVDTSANRMTVRRQAMHLMYNHGLRPTHVSQVIDDIVEMVFIESVQSKRAKLLKTCWANRFGWFSWGKSWD